jgi:uncharacterized membrane protein
MTGIWFNLYEPKSSIMKRHIISHVAIYMLSVVMIVFGIIHFLQPRSLLVFVPQNLPGGIYWVYGVGAAFILAAIAFITNKYVKLAGYLLAALLIVFVLFVHLPNYNQSGDAEMRQNALTSLLKDLALAAFALHIAGSADSHGIKF